MKTNLPSIHRQSSRSSNEPVWLRISAFLSLRSPNTRTTYLGIVNEWCKFLGADAGSTQAARLVLNANDLHATAYRAWLESRPGEAPRMLRKRQSSERGIVADSRATRLSNSKKTGLEHTQSNATIAKKFAALRRIYRMLIASGLGLSENPFDSDRVPAPPKESGRKRPTEMLDFALVMRVVEVPDANSPKGIRDRAILAALFGGALRRSELITIRLGDVRKSPQGTTFLYLRSTKAKKDAQQALASWAAKLILDLIAQRRAEKASDGDYLFICYTGRGGKTPIEEPISASGIYKLFKACCRIAGAGEFLTPHSARATAITKLLTDGVSHRRVQEFSRHSSIQMVEAYDKRRLGVDENPGKELDFEKKKS